MPEQIVDGLAEVSPQPILCDFVWFTPEHYPACLDLIKRLTPEECEARGKHFGLEAWENVPIPKQDGSFTQAGYCVCRDFEGCHFFLPGQLKKGKALIAEEMMLQELKPGLVVGNVQHKVLESDEFKKKAAEHKKFNESLAKKNVEDSIRQHEALTVKAQGAHHRFLVTAAHFAGIREPNRINGNELADIHRAALLMNKELPQYDQWMDQLCPTPKQQEIPTDFLAYVMEAKSALVRRKEIVRPL